MKYVYEKKKDIGKVPEGYKQSPIGIIPEVWEIKQLGEVCPLQRGFDLPADKVEKGRFPVVYSNGILSYHTDYMVKGPGVVTGRSGSIGKVTFVENDYWPHNTSLWVTDFKGNDVKFIYYFLQNFNLKKYSSGSGVPTLNRNDLHIQNVAVPPLAEQRKIAEVLSTWDKAIELQTAIIDKLTLRKKGLMQQLLTGKKRLKGFSDVFNLSSLKSLIDEVSVRNGKQEGIPVLSVTNTRGFVSQLEQFDKEVASEDNSNYKIVYKGQFAYNPSRINVGSIDILRTFERGLLSPMYIVFKVDERKLSADYLCQQLKSWWFVGHISNFVQGSVRDSLSFDGLCSMKFFIPSIKEQNAIAEILSSADREIEKEKKKLEALKQQKKGLMQQLLTGKKRVVV